MIVAAPLVIGPTCGECPGVEAAEFVAERMGAAAGCIVLLCGWWGECSWECDGEGLFLCGGTPPKAALPARGFLGGVLALIFIESVAALTESSTIASLSTFACAEVGAGCCCCCCCCSWLCGEDWKSIRGVVVVDGIVVG